ncbi:MAG: amidotransferase [Deltaproteobacteria bacterium]|nr:amidotransferase [Deltaproteobacteria bacterium]MBN2671894.1 amidotransferase [Deltaproteobacteria bacterium]
MKIHYLQHVPFENLGCLGEMFMARGHSITCTRFFENNPLPPMDTFDVLVVMGGPMGIFDEQQYPWLAKEKHFIKQSIDDGKTVLGICLGAQLVAHVLGAAVYPNKQREIGWFDITPSPQLSKTPLASVLTKPETVFHWHGDTFDLPDGAYLIGSSEACANQGFVYEENIVGLQFHLESTPASIEALLTNCGDELDESEFVQSEQAIRDQKSACTQLNQIAESLISAIGL